MLGIYHKKWGHGDRMDTETALKLAKKSSNQLKLANAFLVLANTCANMENGENISLAQACIDMLELLLERESRIKPHWDTLIRLYAECTCSRRVDCSKVEVQLGGMFLSALKGDPESKTFQLAVLGLGNLCGRSAKIRDMVVAHVSFDLLLKMEPKGSHLLGLLGNISISHQMEELALSVIEYACSNEDAAVTIAQCSMAKCFRIHTDTVEDMLRSKKRSIQESGLNIMAASSTTSIGPTPSLCWMAAHVDENVRRKAQEQITRFIEADLLGFIERGCVSVLWKLALGAKNGDDFAQGSLYALRCRMSSTVERLLLKTLNIEGNEVLRGHVASALVLLAPAALVEYREPLESMVSMFSSPDGYMVALHFFQTIYEVSMAQEAVYEEDEEKKSSQERKSSQKKMPNQEILKSLLTTHDRERMFEAFRQLLENFDELYGLDSQTVDHALVSVSMHALHHHDVGSSNNQHNHK